MVENQERGRCFTSVTLHPPSTKMPKMMLEGTILRMRIGLIIAVSEVRFGFCPSGCVITKGLAISDIIHFPRT